MKTEKYLKKDNKKTEDEILKSSEEFHNKLLDTLYQGNTEATETAVKKKFSFRPLYAVSMIITIVLVVAIVLAVNLAGSNTNHENNDFYLDNNQSNAITLPSPSTTPITTSIPDVDEDVTSHSQIPALDTKEQQIVTDSISESSIISGFEFSKVISPPPVQDTPVVSPPSSKAPAYSNSTLENSQIDRNQSSEDNYVFTIINEDDSYGMVLSNSKNPEEYAVITLTKQADELLTKYSSYCYEVSSLSESLIPFSACEKDGSGYYFAILLKNKDEYAFIEYVSPNNDFKSIIPFINSVLKIKES